MRFVGEEGVVGGPADQARRDVPPAAGIGRQEHMVGAILVRHDCRDPTPARSMGCERKGRHEDADCGE
jgi:hypothetical protein